MEHDTAKIYNKTDKNKVYKFCYELQVGFGSKINPFLYLLTFKMKNFEYTEFLRIVVGKRF